MRQARPRALAALAFALAAAASCGGAPSFEGDVYRGGGLAFRVGPVPASWQRIEASHAALAFRDDANETTIALDGRCGGDADDVPLGALTNHLFLQFTDREVLSQEVVPFDAREAMHTVLVAKLDGVPKQFDVWVLKKDGCVYDLYAIAEPSRFDASIGDFRRFVAGFATLPGGKTP